jgi:hypothetical protein
MLHSTSAPRTLLALLLPLALALGCARTAQDVTGPAAATVADLELDPQALVIGESGLHPDFNAAPFFPLEVGNHWTYGQTIVLSTIPQDGEATNEVLHMTNQHELMCVQKAGSNNYVAERRTSENFLGPADFWIYYRQDGRGLYEVDDNSALVPCASALESSPVAARATSDATGASAWDRLWARRTPLRSPEDESSLQREWARQSLLHQRIRFALGMGPAVGPSRLPPTEAQANEIQRLRYPMHTGQQWLIRPDPMFASRVVARQRLRTEAGLVTAYKIRIISDLFSPRDRVFLWYGPVGYVGMVAQLEGIGVDKAGNFTRMVTQDIEILTGYQLQEPVARN